MLQWPPGYFVCKYIFFIMKAGNVKRQQHTDLTDLFLPLVVETVEILSYINIAKTHREQRREDRGR